MKVIKCVGEGLGSCKRCTDNGKWNRMWMCLLYKIEGKGAIDGCYCSDCVQEIEKEYITSIKTKLNSEFGIMGKENSHEN